MLGWLIKQEIAYLLLSSNDCSTILISKLLFLVPKTYQLFFTFFDYYFLLQSRDYERKITPISEIYEIWIFIY